MSRRNSREDDGSDNSVSEHDDRGGRSRYATKPTPSDREPEYGQGRRRPIPPSSNRRSRDRDEDLVERRPPVNRDTRERRPPPGRPCGDMEDRGRDDSRSTSRDRNIDRNVRGQNEDIDNRGRAYNEYGDEGSYEYRRLRNSRDRYDDMDSRHESRDRDSRHNSWDRYRDDDEHHKRELRNSRDRAVNSSRDRYNDGREDFRGRSSGSRYRDDSDSDDLGRYERYDVRGSDEKIGRASHTRQRTDYDDYQQKEISSSWARSERSSRDYEREHDERVDNIRESRDRTTRSSRDGGRDIRRSKEAPRGFTPKSYSQSSGAAPSQAWNDHNSRESRYYEKENTHPTDSWTTSINRRAPPSSARPDYHSDLVLEEEESASGNYQHARRGQGRENATRYEERRTTSRSGGAPNSRGYGDSSDFTRTPDRALGRDDRFRDHLEYDDIDVEASQDNNIKPFSGEKSITKKRIPQRRQLSPDNALRRTLDLDEDEHDEERRYGTRRGETDSDDDRNKSEQHPNRDGISNQDIERLDNFRKSGRYGDKASLDKEKVKPGAYTYKPSGNVSLVHYCPPNGGNTDLFQCFILRERNTLTSKLYPTYKLYSQEGEKLLILAQKMSMNSTSNYHLFDMTRGVPEKTHLTKKSGNYIGKLRGIDSNHTEYVVVTKSEAKEEVAAIQFDRLGLVSQLKEGCQPRKMSILLPSTNSDNEPIPHSLKYADGSKRRPKSLSTLLRRNDFGNMFHLVSKDPIYENGNYRLNFHGRVSIPSVKNFQLTAPDDIDDVICQFGKVGEEKFNLDFKYPLNPFQAFSLALCHFDA